MFDYKIIRFVKNDFWFTNHEQKSRALISNPAGIYNDLNHKYIKNIKNNNPLKWRFSQNKRNASELHLPDGGGMGGFTSGSPSGATTWAPLSGRACGFFPLTRSK